MKIQQSFLWLKEWLESDEIENEEIENLDILKTRLDNEFGVRQNILEFVIGSIEDGFPKTKPDIVITKERKGTKLIRNYIVIKNLDIYHIPLNLVNQSQIKDKNVLIFDDGVHYGNTAREIIDRIVSMKPAQIEFFSLIADKPVLDKLRRDFPDIKFTCSEEVPSKDYTNSYNRLFYRLFDILPRSLDNYLEYYVNLTSIEHPKKIAEALVNIPNTRIYQVPTLEKDESEIIKGTILFNAYPTNSKIDCDYNISMYKIRFYIYLNPSGGIDFVFTPVLQLLDVDLSGCKKNLTDCLCNNDLENDEKICLDCIEINLTRSLLDDFRTYFESEIRISKIHINRSELDWDKVKKYGIDIE